jgi:hypothetical protein
MSNEDVASQFSAIKTFPLFGPLLIPSNVLVIGIETSLQTFYPFEKNSLQAHFFNGDCQFDDRVLKFLFHFNVFSL